MLNAHKEVIDKEAIKEVTKVLGGEYDHTDPNVRKGKWRYLRCMLGNACLLFKVLIIIQIVGSQVWNMDRDGNNIIIPHCKCV